MFTDFQIAYLKAVRTKVIRPFTTSMMPSKILHKPDRWYINPPSLMEIIKKGQLCKKIYMVVGLDDSESYSEESFTSYCDRISGRRGTFQYSSTSLKTGYFEYNCTPEIAFLFATPEKFFRTIKEQELMYYQHELRISPFMFDEINPSLVVMKNLLKVQEFPLDSHSKFSARPKVIL